MEEMKVGDFIRTKDGYVGKILRLGDEFSYDCIYESGDFKYAIGFHSIAKHSPNVIDLIEVGDYVNGHLVYSILIDNDFKGVQVESDHLLYHTIEEKDIDSIVTHEQFNSIKYVIGE